LVVTYCTKSKTATPLEGGSGAIGVKKKSTPSVSLTRRRSTNLLGEGPRLSFLPRKRSTSPVLSLDRCRPTSASPVSHPWKRSAPLPVLSLSLRGGSTPPVL
jgi:hypothetical protein